MTAVGSWRTSLVVQGLELETGEPVLVAVGLLHTEAGGVKVALKVGENKPTAERLGGDER